MNKMIYIADDDLNIRNIIKSFLINDGYDVQDFENGDLLYKKLISDKPDMVILDIMMKGTSGLDICNKIRKNSNIPIIMISAKDSDLDKITGITIGADDYLAKPFSPLELLVRIKAIFRRMNNQLENKQRIEYCNLIIDNGKRQCVYENVNINLTTIEFDLLYLLVSNKGNAVSKKEILKTVWKITTDIDTKVIDDTLKRLRKKLYITNVKIVSIWGYGFRVGCEKNED